MESESLFLQKTIQVDPGQAPIRIDKYILERIEKVSRSRVQQAIQNGKVTVNGQPIKPNYKVRPNDVLLLTFPTYRYDEYIIEPEKVDFDVIYEDEEVMVVNKPAGLVVHPGIGNRSGTLVNGLAHYLEHSKLPVKEGNQVERMGLVHRIDKNTTGLLVVAKTDHAMSHLSKQFHDKKSHREYLALIWGEPDETIGSVEGFIGRDAKHRKKRKNYQKEEQGKWSKTHYEILERMYYVSLIKCKLETGRTHQIRVHLSDMGHPLFADDLYGGKSIRKGTVFSKYKQFVENCFKIMNRHALHAKTLGFTHPGTGKWMEFDSQLPEDFTQLIDKWKKYVNHRKDQIHDEGEDH